MLHTAASLLFPIYIIGTAKNDLVGRTYQLIYVMEDVFMSEMIAAVVFIILAAAGGIWVWWIER